MYFDNISDQKVIHHTQAKERIICKNHLEFHHFFSRLCFTLILSFGCGLSESIHVLLYSVMILMI